MESIGELLRQARHTKQASLEDASRATRIKLEILERLEADEFDQLAAPTYTKGFLKLYSEYLGLESGAIVEAYLKSQGGLRRQGLHVETEAAIRKKGKRELKLPIRSVVRVVGALTVAFVVVLVVAHWWLHRSPRSEQGKSTPPHGPKNVTLPKADFEAYYQPKTKPASELLDPSGK